MLQAGSSEPSFVDHFTAALPVALCMVTIAGAGASAYVMTVDRPWTVAEGMQRSLDATKDYVHTTKTTLAVVDTRLTNVDTRLTNVENTLTKVETRLTNVETHLVKVENTLTKVESAQQLQLALSFLLTAGMGYLVTRRK